MWQHLRDTFVFGTKLFGQKRIVSKTHSKQLAAALSPPPLSPLPFSRPPPPATVGIQCRRHLIPCLRFALPVALSGQSTARTCLSSLLASPSPACCFPLPHFPSRLLRFMRTAHGTQLITHYLKVVTPPLSVPPFP